jgi:hypothetical protein
MKMFWVSVAFLTSALDGGEWSASRPGRFTTEVSPPGIHCIGGNRISTIFNNMFLFYNLHHYPVLNIHLKPSVCNTCVKLEGTVHRKGWRLLLCNFILQGNAHLGDRKGDGRMALRWILGRRVLRMGGGWDRLNAVWKAVCGIGGAEHLLQDAVLWVN